MCWNVNLCKVICFTDSLHVLGLVQEGNYLLHNFGNEIALIRDLPNRDWDCQLLHTLREDNVCADFLAKQGSHGNSTFLVLTTPPRDLVDLIVVDAAGTQFVRL